jgi:hypothetical protein
MITDFAFSPGGRPMVAQRFSAGYDMTNDPSPGGTTDQTRGFSPEKLTRERDPHGPAS